VIPIIVRPAAAADIEDAFLWYERQHPGLGVEFLDAVQAACESIALVSFDDAARNVHATIQHSSGTCDL